MLPIIPKPKVDYNYTSFVKEIPNALSIAQINRLREYALGGGSGWHRRGSKNPNTHASFSTCQVHPLNDEIYEILDPLWEPYKNILSFIEPYEIKSYYEGDSFGYHTDAYFNLVKQVDRKMNLIIQMSDPSEYDGGDLFISDHIICSKDQGTAIFFPSTVYHKVTPITRGNRFSLIGHGWSPYVI